MWYILWQWHIGEKTNVSFYTSDFITDTYCKPTIMWLFFLFILQHIDRGIPKRTTVMQIKTVAPSTAAMKMVKGAYLMQLLARFYQALTGAVYITICWSMHHSSHPGSLPEYQCMWKQLKQLMELETTQNNKFRFFFTSQSGRMSPEVLSFATLEWLFLWRKSIAVVSH